MSSPCARSALAVLLVCGFALPARAQDAPELGVRLEPGAVLRYRGEGTTACRPTGGGRSGETTRRWKADSRIFVLSVDGSGGARVALHDRVETSCASGEFPSYSDSRVDLASLGRDGSLRWNTGEFPWDQDTFAVSFLGPGALPKGPVRAGATWTGSFPIPPFESLTLEPDFVLVAFEDLGGERIARIRADLAGKKIAGEDDSPEPELSGEMREGSVVEYEVAVASGVARRGRISLSYALFGRTEDAEIRVDFAFELLPAEPPSPAHAGAIARALELLGAFDYASFPGSLASCGKAAGASDWALLASDLQSNFPSVPREALDGWETDVIGRESGPKREGEGGPLPRSFEPSRITLDLKDVKASQVLEAVEKQTGNRVPVSARFNDGVFSEFKAANEPFWTVLDRLCGVSGNDFGLKTLIRGG